MARMVVDDTSLCFINCHLAAGQHALRSRNADIAAMLECKPFRQAVDEPLAYVGGGDGTMVLDHEIVFVCRGLSRVFLIRADAAFYPVCWRHKLPHRPTPRSDILCRRVW